MEPMGLLVAGFDASPVAEDEFDAWYDAFKAQPGQKLYLAPEQRVKIW